MGYAKERRPLAIPGALIGPKTLATASTAVGGLNVDMTLVAATNGVKFGRLVRVKTDGAAVPTTGSSGRSALGVSRSSASSGSSFSVRVWGVVNAVASTGAVAKGAYLRGASGPSTGVNAGCVKTSTGAAINSVVGIALTSAAAAAVSTGRTIKVLLTHQGQTLI
jgi:hypothetical protein